jgi:cell division protein FtsW
VVGLLPTKGLPLPFVSFGGSSLLAAMAGVGLILNISQHAELGDVAETRGALA